MPTPKAAAPIEWARIGGCVAECRTHSGNVRGDTERVRGAVLAGGAASRFGGGLKGLERVGGERILDRVTRAVQAATGRRPLLVANAPDAKHWRPDLEVRGDTMRDCGSLGGIYTALTAGEGPVLVVAWDMPFVPAELLEALISRAEGYDACLPESGGPNGGLEPLCAVYGPACANPIGEHLLAGDFRASGFLGAVRLGTLSPDEIERCGDSTTMFLNINTPADLDRARRLWRAQHG